VQDEHEIVVVTAQRCPHT